MTDLTPQTVAALAEKATPGPYLYRPKKYDDWGMLRAGEYVLCQVRDPRFLDLDRARAEGRDPWEDSAQFLAAAPSMAALIAAQAAEIERLRGLTWYAWHEFNAIRARSGAPLDQYGMTTVATEYWDQMTKAFKVALPVEDQKPWPPEYARAALEGTKP